MPVFMLSGDLVFPPAHLAREDGLLCVGGDLSVKRLILAYEKGIFPWYGENDPICWWSPDPRLVLFPSDIKIARSLRKKLRKQPFSIRINEDFEQTVKSCAHVNNRQQEGTWITSEMIDAYIRLNKKGMAHSIEAWSHDSLVGGLYGICIGRCFFGESMFTKETDASKITLAALSQYLMEQEFSIIDCQVKSDHLMKMGAVLISRESFLAIIEKSINLPVSSELWKKGKDITPSNL